MAREKKKKKGTKRCNQRLPVEPSPPYDEFNQTLLNNTITVRVPKGVGRIEPVSGAGNADCCPAEGPCKVGWAKLNVFPNEAPPPKDPDEEMTTIRTTRRILSPEEMQSSLEIEFRTARNYEPAPVMDSLPFDPVASAKMLEMNAAKRKAEKAAAKKARNSNGKRKS